MILDTNNDMVLNYQDGRLSVAYELVGTPAERELQRATAAEYLVSSAHELRDAVLTIGLLETILKWGK